MTLVEKVARAIHAVEESSKAVNFSNWQSYIPTAKATIAAIEENHVIVSKEEYERINN